MDQDEKQEPHIPQPITVVPPSYVAQCFGVNITSLKAMWERGDIPRPIKIGVHTRYYLHEILECLDKANAARNAPPAPPAPKAPLTPSANPPWNK